MLSIVFRLRIWSTTLACLALVLGAPLSFGDGVAVETTPPPDRDGDGVLEGTDVGCPPVDANGNKIMPNNALDDDKDDPPDGVDDYFMGEWKFVKGKEDLIVRKWCMNRAETRDAFTDFFTFEAIASENGEEIDPPVVAAGDEAT